jgi:hypothetical protein
LDSARFAIHLQLGYGLACLFYPYFMAFPAHGHLGSNLQDNANPRFVVVLISVSPLAQHSYLGTSFYFIVKEVVF